MIDPQISEWISQIIRWIHVITAIAWIGSSFYFIHSDLSLKKREGLARASAARPGRSWRRLLQHAQVSGCAARDAEGADLVQVGELFRGVDQRLLPDRLGLLPSRGPLHHRPGRACAPSRLVQAPAIGIGGIVASWLVYEGLCRSPLGRNGVVLGRRLFVYILLARPSPSLRSASTAAPPSCTRRDDRDLDVGQRLLRHHPEPEEGGRRASLGRLAHPEARQGGQAARLHNNYLTLPVIFLMLSNHYPLAWSSRYSVAIIGLIVIAGAVIRHFFNRSMPARARPGGPGAWRRSASRRDLALDPRQARLCQPGRTLRPMQRRGRHGSLRRGGPRDPVPLLHVPRGRARLGRHRHRPEGRAPRHAGGDRAHAEIIRVQSVLTHAMPPNNITEMTLDERKAVATWLASKGHAPPASHRVTLRQ